MIEEIEQILREHAIEQASSPTMEAALAIAAALEEDLQNKELSLESELAVVSA